MKKYNSVISIFAIIAMIAMNFGLISNVEAATVTSLSDTLSTVTTGAAASHTIKFVTPTGVAAGAGDAGKTIIVTFPATFNFTDKTIGTVTFTHGITTGAENSEPLIAVADATNWGAAFTGTQNRVLTLTAPTDGVGSGGVITAGHKIIIAYNSTNSLNATTGTYTMTISGTFGDSGSLQIAIITDDSVDVTATVNPTLSFGISDNDIFFGTLDSTAVTGAKWAHGTTTTGSTTDVSAHTMTIATNAASGYSITYNGATLTTTIPIYTISEATISNDANGVPGTEQFAMGFSISGTGAVNALYDHNTTDTLRDWKFVAGTTTEVVSHTAPVAVASTTISAYYLANIADTTEPGSYSTNITYIATGIF